MTEPIAQSRSDEVSRGRAVEITTSERAAQFRTIFDGESSYVWNTLRRLGVAPHDLDDLCHDVFVAVFRRLADYDTTRPLRPWLFGIAFREASDYRRLVRHHREVPGDPPDIPDAAPAADERIASDQDLALVIQALDELELDRRAVLVMHDFDGSPMPDVAATLGIGLNTAYSRLRLARKQFTESVRRRRIRRGDEGAT